MPDEPPPDYPAEWETHAVLSDGAPVEIRPIRPGDRAALDAFHRRQSPTSIYYRFFQHRPRLSDAELDRFTKVDYLERMAFVALDDNELVAVARYESATGGDRPELAFIVDDRHHRRGLATLLLEYLAAAARARGVPGFIATVLPENHGMLRVFRRAGFDVETRFVDGLIDVELDISLTPQISEAIADRQSRARSASVARLLRPRSVAVVGAGRRPGSVGHELFKHVLAGGFAGEVYGVNPAADEILGQPIRPSLGAIDAEVDLAIVAVPAEVVEAVVADAAAADVSGLLIVSSGFGERSPEGERRERALVDMVRDHGMRLIGPNAFGMINTASDVGLRALFLPIEPEPGVVAVASQSGPLGGALLNRLTEWSVGVSSFVALGNRADVSVNDLLEYWRVDVDTEVVLLYVENVGNLRTFAGTARSVTSVKPVVAMRPESDHVRELLVQSGVIVVDAVADMVRVAKLLTDQPRAAGNRVAIVSNAGSVARLADTACRRVGLDVVTPSSVEQTVTAERAHGAVLVDDIEAVSVAGGRGDAGYEQILIAAGVSEEVDSLLLAMVPTLDFSFERVRDLIDTVNRSIQKPVVAAGLVGGGTLAVPGVPTFTFPEEAARALGSVTGYVQWLESRPSRPDRLDPDPDVVAEGARLAQLVGNADSDELVVTLWAPESDEVVSLLDVPVPPWTIGTGLDELLTGADRVGYPVVLKARDAANRAIGEAGGVAIDLHDEAQLRAAFGRMQASSTLELLPAAVQRMINGVGNIKVELIQDPSLGSFVTVGPGGAAAENAPASHRRFVPVDLAMIDEELDRLAGSVSIDTDARRVVTALVQRLSDLAVVVPELALVSVNPLILAGPSTAAGDLTVVLRPWKRDPLSEVRRL